MPRENSWTSVFRIKRSCFLLLLLFVSDLACANATLVNFSVESSIVAPQANAPAPLTWTPVTQPAQFVASAALLLTDGTVMVQQYQSPNWWKLAPDSTGSYIDGAWSQLASTTAAIPNYWPNWFASAVLSDGRVIIVGGEFNYAVSSGQEESNLGGIYDPVANTWTASAPTGIDWAKIGDVQSVVRPDGKFMIGSHSYPVAIFDRTNSTWTTNTPTHKNDPYSEEGWTLLPGGKILTVDTYFASTSEIFTQSSNSWATISMPVNLNDGGFCNEIGPAVLRPNGTVFALGANASSAIYTPSANPAWSVGPSLASFGSNLGVADGPAAPLPNGNVLFEAAPTDPTSSSTCFETGAKFFEFDGSPTYAQVATPSTAVNDFSYQGRMLVLPTGQIFFTNESGQPQVYQPAGTYQAAWQPAISSVPTTLNRGTTYTLSGTQLNGLTQGAMYGDDAQMATNYPLVRLTNSLHVRYARTHAFSTMAVATGTTTVSTQFDIPANMQGGLSTLVVVANGIPSQPVNVNIVCALDGLFCNSFE